MAKAKSEGPGAEAVEANEATVAAPVVDIEKFAAQVKAAILAEAHAELAVRPDDPGRSFVVNVNWQGERFQHIGNALDFESALKKAVKVVKAELARRSVDVTEE